MTKTINNVGAGSHRRRRRMALASTGAVALLLAFASVAYACTLLIGEFTVCSPKTANGLYSEATFAGQCAKRSLTGPQVDVVTFDDGGTQISIKSTGFSATVPGGGTVYSLTFAVSGPSCHAFNVSGGVTSLLGTWDHDGNAATAQVPRTLEGPAFTVGIGANSSDPITGQGSAGDYDTITTPAVSVLGPYSVCAQDEPERVDGSAILGQVSLL